MKQVIKLKSDQRAFTLVELLVVIAIIAALAAISVSVSRKMLGKAQASQAVQNLRQIGAVLITHATDHSMKLPAAKAADTLLPDGTTAVGLQWTEACLLIVYPDTPVAEFRKDQWWESTKSFMRNPMLKESAGWTPLNPGYAMNLMVAQNLAAAQTPQSTADLATVVSLASIPDPERTPIVAPNNISTYTYDTAEIAKFDESPLKELLSDGKAPILFVDGHVESMTPEEYANKNLDEMPLAPGN